MTCLVELIGRAIADADKEDYMEDCQRYDDRARAALAAIDVAGLAALPKILDWRSTLDLTGEVTMEVVETAYNRLAREAIKARVATLAELDRAIALARIEMAVVMRP